MCIPHIPITYDVKNDILMLFLTCFCLKYEREWCDKQWKEQISTIMIENLTLTMLTDIFCCKSCSVDSEVNVWWLWYDEQNQS